MNESQPNTITDLVNSKVVTLDELIEKKPSELSREEEDQIIARMIEKRDKWASEENAAKSEGRRAKTKSGTARKKKSAKDIPQEVNAILANLEIKL